MGCGSSKGTSPAQKETQKQDLSDDTFIYTSQESIKLAYTYMTKNAYSYPLCFPMIPIVCIEKQAFPILLHDIFFQESSAIHLPIISAAFYGQGRILAIPNINVFSEIPSDHPENGIFLSDAVSWLCKNETTMAPILLYNFSPALEEEICYFLHSHGFFVEKGSKGRIKALSSYRSIFLSTQFNPTLSEMDEFTNYVSDGGSLFIAFCPTESQPIEDFFDIPINPFLIKFGFSYTLYTIEKEDFPNSGSIIPIDSAQFSHIQKCHFLALYDYLDSILSEQKQPDVTVLDDLVTAIRYHIIVVDDRFQNYLPQFFSTIFRYLIKSHAVTSDNLFCPHPNHCILMNLIQDILSRTPPKFFFPIIGHEIFPGESILSSEFQSIQNIPNNYNYKLYHDQNHNDQSSNDQNHNDQSHNDHNSSNEQNVENMKFDLHLNPNSNCEKVLTTDVLEFDIIDETWLSTGLYLPAGIEGFIELDEPQPDIHIQIGSHMEILDSKNSPWPRWPNLISAYALDDVKVAVSTLFGGIVYVAASKKLPTSLHLKITFLNFLPYPRYVKSDPSIWEKTRNSQIPFGEIEGNFIIVSLPSSYIHSLESKLEIIINMLDQICDISAKYLSFESERLHRLVFDNAFSTNNSLVGYPIIFPLIDLMPLLNEIEKPTHYLYALSNLIALVSIRENCFDQEVEYALSDLTASVTFSKLFKDFYPDRFSNDHGRTLFNALWKIHTDFGEDIIPKSIAKFQSPSYYIIGSPDDRWLELVKEISIVGKMDITPDLQAIRPIPLNFNTGSRYLPSFKTVKHLQDYDKNPC